MIEIKKIDPLDIVGKKYGKLKVVEYNGQKITPTNKTKRHYYKCECECGKEVVLIRNSLITGNTTSCGCIRETKIDPQDVIGKEFGKLKVLKYCYKTKNDYSGYKYYYLCLCDCGNETLVERKNIMSERILSCGCLHDEFMKKLAHYNHERKLNKYIKLEDVYIGYTNNNKEFIIDEKSYDLVKDYAWYAKDDGYIVAWDRNRNKIISMHRLLMELLDTPDKIVDHKNHNVADNRLENLRTGTQQNNMCNRLTPSNNTTGRMGVYWHKRDCVWEVNIGYNNKQYYIGRYESFKDAEDARRMAEEKYFGEWLFDNSTNYDNVVNL